MSNFIHNCTEEKVKWQDYKKAIHDSKFSYAQIAMIWDFYVTHSFAGSSGQEIKLSDYGWDQKDKTILKIENLLMRAADIENLCCIRANTINKTLKNYGLADEYICVNHPRIALQQKYSVTVDENEIMKFSGGGENRITCLFRHIRNAFAHSNTYFFDNGNTLLEDKANSKVTARILIKQQTLLDWISIVDKDKKFYNLIDVCSNCKISNK